MNKRKSSLKEELKGWWILISTILGFILFGIIILAVVNFIGWIPHFLNNFSDYLIWVIGIPLGLVLIGALICAIGWLIEKLKD